MRRYYYWLLILLVHASIIGCSSVGAGLRDGAATAIAPGSGAPSFPDVPAGLNIWQALLYTVATAVAYGGVKLIQVQPWRKKV